MLNTPPPSDLLISNMGEVDLVDTAIRKGCGGAVVAMPGRRAATQIIAVETEQGCLCLTHTSQEPIPELLAGMANRLLQSQRPSNSSTGAC